MTDERWRERWRNWVRWCRRDGRHYGRVGSAEGGWSSPQCWYPPEPRPLEVDDPDAELVNRAYTASPAEARRVIQLIMFRGRNWRRSWIAQKLGLHRSRLTEALYRSKKIMRELLELQEESRYSGPRKPLRRQPFTIPGGIVAYGIERVRRFLGAPWSPDR